VSGGGGGGGCFFRRRGDIDASVSLGGGGGSCCCRRVGGGKVVSHGGSGGGCCCRRRGGGGKSVSAGWGGCCWRRGSGGGKSMGGAKRHVLVVSVSAGDGSRGRCGRLVPATPAEVTGRRGPRLTNAANHASCTSRAQAVPSRTPCCPASGCHRVVTVTVSHDTTDARLTTRVGADTPVTLVAVTHQLLPGSKQRVDSKASRGICIQGGCVVQRGWGIRIWVERGPSRCKGAPAGYSCRRSMRWNKPSCACERPRER